VTSDELTIDTAEELIATDLAAPAFSDEALALAFAAKFLTELRYVASWAKWMIWQGDHWKADDTLFAFHRARQICRAAAMKCNKGGSKARRIASSQTEAAVERLARSDRRLAATVEQWDGDPWLLNTPGGVVDLKTGTMRPHDPLDYLTKITAVAPGGDCPTWLAFLNRVTGGDAELQVFIKRVCGYTLSGDTSEHALFFLFGHGANGKSVFVETIAAIVGSYHRTAPIETFTATSSERHPTELAGLMGARLVSAVETEEGRRWAESRIKTLTGGDTIAARFMRQDYFEFTPQFKLMIAGNHKPGLRSVDEAIRRRLHLVPFGITIPADERDLHLKEKLQAEWPGILAWMIEGCLEWQADGLRPPRAVVEATTAYLDAEDAISAWLIESCMASSDGWESGVRLFASWKAWADREGEPPGSLRRLRDNLETRGLTAARKNNLRGFQGVMLRPATSATSSDNRPTRTQGDYSENTGRPGSDS
jgi:putative DNA primase/helicase